MMSCASALLLLGFLLRLVASYPEGSCDTYENISEPYRNSAFSSTTTSVYPLKDTKLVNKWVRFVGIGGDKVAEACPPTNHGSTMYPLYFPTTLPSEVNGSLSGDIYMNTGSCTTNGVKVTVAQCPGGFFVYKPDAHAHPDSAFVTAHFSCGADSCGPLAECNSGGGCICVTGYKVPDDTTPTENSFGCADIDECAVALACGSHATCENNEGSFTCTCIGGYEVTTEGTPAGTSNPCIDTDECLTHPCGQYGTCANSQGDYACTCQAGFDLFRGDRPECVDIDECLEDGVCGPNSACHNNPGSFTCTCLVGYEPTNTELSASVVNICTDISECTVDEKICGPDANCTNTIGSYLCPCFSGYRKNNEHKIASYMNPCLDIDECAETEDICGRATICTNAPGTFYCSCPDGFYPSTGIVWTMDVSFCQRKSLPFSPKWHGTKSILPCFTELTEILDALEGDNKQKAFLDNMEQDILNNSGAAVPDATVVNSMTASVDVVALESQSKSSGLSSEGDAEVGSLILGLSETLINKIVSPNENGTHKHMHTRSVDLDIRGIGPRNPGESTANLSANGNVMEINLQGLAGHNNGTAAAAFVTLNGLENLLSHTYFKTVNKTEMMSDILTAYLPTVNNTNLTEPVNFTIMHKMRAPESGYMTCVYWADKDGEHGSKKSPDQMRWSQDGCWSLFSNENYTICSCIHLSTFALIMQIGEPPPDNSFLEWLNRVCVIVGLFFFGLAILTFLLCSWNPKINNTARLHLCLSLAMSHLLLLWNDEYVDEELACTVIAGLLHFLIIASFMWMLLEALQLHLLVRRLSKVQVIQRDGLPKPALYLVGYGVPLVIVGVSALVYSDGYGVTATKDCFLSDKRNFRWSLTGPLIFILGVNFTLFLATLWSLKPTLANMKSGSQSKDTKMVVFKILAQFVILGCTWILGFYQTNLFFQVLFIFLNSQQGTFLFIVHCVLNKEVREEYIRWLSCGKTKTEEKDAPSVTEDFDKQEEQTDEKKKQG
ncbi:adhesion G protein-coupled receptor E2-like isoform X1 [Synchiropus splendidus]|uniref:adhesion G protein-coupled receptor E2-like isoform X1 n=1 Tax=Synchiropus splendidus TaxID=270530 RepID=UPI00237DB0B9|nr:adhesion G protein-coupled receptor E2-like isoform X1 [Synchiropus splendidus]XP_053707715.1 adhesion G protein-coupled receptor E2-like isoform X1 [Synchiropus splendidus]